MQTRLTWLLAGAAALALTYAPGARAADDDQLLGGCDSAQGCAITALEGLVSGFTGQAGGDLWGWMIGGGQSAGTSGIAEDLGTIESALSTMETELAGIQNELEQLSCSIDGTVISTYAGPIQSYYQKYSGWLQEMCNPDSEGKCQNTHVSLPGLKGVSEWANCAVGFPTAGQSCEAGDVVTLLNELNDAASGAGGSDGAISDCIKAKAAAVTPPSAGSLDDRPYYSQVVEPITSWYLTINTQAMTVLTEAYHFRAWQAAGSPSSSSTDDLYTNVCDVSPIPDGCMEPIIIYNDDFAGDTGFVWSQLQAGGAPYSTSDHVTLNGTVDGTTWLMVKSIETYNAAANQNCGDPSTKLCGPTVGPPGFAMKSVAVGPYGFGSGGEKGTWTPAHAALFDTIILEAPFDPGVDVTLGRFLCTLSQTGGNTTNCIQPPTSTDIPAASGLKGADGKGFYFPDTFEYSKQYNPNRPYEEVKLNFQCFMDGNLSVLLVGQPTCNQARFDHILLLSDDVINDGCEIQEAYNADGLKENSDVTGVTMGIFPNYYNAAWCFVQGGWKVRPGYALPLQTYPKSWHWPVLDLATITCPNGEAATKNLNPAGVPTLCGDAFDTWFNTQVPPGPPQATAIADATLDRSDPNRNNGANPRLLLVGHQHRTLLGFDPDELQAFLDANPLASARLVLSSVDRSVGAANLWLQATPLDGTFVEGNGNAAERDRGEGGGATWNCAEDVEIADFMKECVQDWPHRFGRGRGTTVKVPDGSTGKVSFDVSEDVANGASAWVIRRLRGGHSAAFHSREGAALLDAPSLAPTLLLIPADEDEVTADAK